MEASSGRRSTGVPQALRTVPLIVLGFGVVVGAYIAAYFVAFPGSFPSFPLGGPVWTALILATGPLGFFLSAAAAYLEGDRMRKRTAAALVVGILLFCLALTSLPALWFHID